MNTQVTNQAKQEVKWTTEGWFKTHNNTQIYRRYVEGFLCIERDQLYTECGLEIECGGYEGFKEGQANRAVGLAKIQALIDSKYTK